MRRPHNGREIPIASQTAAAHLRHQGSSNPTRAFLNWSLEEVVGLLRDALRDAKTALPLHGEAVAIATLPS